MGFATVTLRVTALGTGSATVTATVGAASADVEIEVLQGPLLPAGTNRWVVAPGAGTVDTTVVIAHPATPESPSLFTLELTAVHASLPTVRAFGRDGAEWWWPASLPLPMSEAALDVVDSVIGDAAGGIVASVARWQSGNFNGHSVVRLGPTPSAGTWRYDAEYTVEMAQNADGVVYVLEAQSTDAYSSSQVVVGLDGDTGAVLFRTAMPTRTTHYDDWGGAPVTTVAGSASRLVVGADGDAFVQESSSA